MRMSDWSADVCSSDLLPGGAQPAGTYEAADGNTRVLSFMLNALLDFGNDDGWNGYIGGGAGVARVKESEYQLAKSGPAFVDASDPKFAWQAFVGVRRAITTKLDFGLKSRIFTLDAVKTVDVKGENKTSRQ